MKDFNVAACNLQLILCELVAMLVLTEHEFRMWDLVAYVGAGSIDRDICFETLVVLACHMIKYDKKIYIENMYL